MSTPNQCHILPIHTLPYTSHARSFKCQIKLQLIQLKLIAELWWSKNFTLFQTFIHSYSVVTKTNQTNKSRNRNIFGIIATINTSHNFSLNSKWNPKQWPKRAQAQASCQTFNQPHKQYKAIWNRFFSSYNKSCGAHPCINVVKRWWFVHVESGEKKRPLLKIGTIQNQTRVW